MYTRLKKYLFITKIIRRSKKKKKCVENNFFSQLVFCISEIFSLSFRLKRRKKKNTHWTNKIRICAKKKTLLRINKCVTFNCLLIGLQISVVCCGKNIFFFISLAYIRKHLRQTSIPFIFGLKWRKMLYCMSLDLRDFNDVSFRILVIIFPRYWHLQLTT